MIKNINIKSVLLFTLPSVITMLFMSVYMMVDGVFVSNFINETALSAINISYPAMSIVLALGLMLGTGGNAICAKLLGEKKTKEAREKFTLFIIVGFIIGLLSILIIRLNLDSILVTLGAGEETYKYCYDYLGILIFFFPALLCQIIFQNAFIASNKPGIALISMVCGGVCNIVLDYVFIELFGWEMAGAAIATGIGYAVPFIIGLVYFSSKKRSALRFVKTKFDLIALKSASINGSSEMVTHIATAVTTFLFNMIMLELVGSDGVAAITVVIYAQMLLGALYMGYSMGISPVISFNYGEENSKNLRKLFWISIKFIIIISLICTVGSLLLAEPITKIFTSDNSGVYDLSVNGLRIFAIGFIFSGINVFASALFTSYSNGLISAIISFARTFVLIIIAILVLPIFFGVNGVWLAIPVAEFITLFISIFFLIKYKKKYMYAKTYEAEVKHKHNIITISREFSSGGREVAKRLADKLGYAYYDDEMLLEMLDSKEHEKIHIHSYALTFSKSFDTYKSHNSYTKHQEQAKLIGDLANKENTIFVGRCADYILHNFNPFKVYIYSSSMEDRINRCFEKATDNDELSNEVIEKNIRKIDRARNLYYRQFTGFNRGNINNYNLSIDTSKIDIKKAVNIISDIFKTKK